MLSQSVREEPEVVCILLNWNGWRDTVSCLESLQSSTYRNYTVLVVDNGSTDDSVARIKAAFPDQEVLENGVNLGFGAGNNRGLRLALDRGADYVWLLNNDTIVPADTLRAMVTCACDCPNAGQVGSVLRYWHNPEQIQAWGGGTINLWTGRSTHFHQPVRERQLLYMTAASVLIPRAVLESVGLFDERFFMYCEDTDLSLRIHGMGRDLVVCEGAQVLHKEGASSRHKPAAFDGMVSSSVVLFLRKHAPFPPVAVGIFIGGRVLKRLLAGRFDACREIVAGWWRAPRLG